VADTWSKCQSPLARFVLVQLSRNALPIDEQFRDVSFARAYLHPEGNVRAAFVMRRLVVELCRYLSNLESSGDAFWQAVRER
jgi:hypothetical protein